MKLTIVAPCEGSWDAFCGRMPLLPFSKDARAFVQVLSDALLAEHRRNPEVIALGYWLRRTHIDRLAQGFEQGCGNSLRKARGIAFHIAPANVDTIFVYSWLLSMLVGNLNVVRLPSSDSEQLDLLVGVITDLLQRPDFNAIKERNLLVRYGHDDEVNRELSAQCDLRVIWGGDETVRRLRTFTLKPSAKELCFVDKFSLALLDAEAVLTSEGISTLVSGFYNDAYGFAQMACSSPRLIVWRGEEERVVAAQTVFWRALEKLVGERPPEVPLAARMEKLVVQYGLAMDRALRLPVSTSSYINRVSLQDLSALPVDEHCGGGLFYEARISALEEIAPLMSQKIQTMAVAGIGAEEIRMFLSGIQSSGIDRVVAVGQALTFDAHWDGYDLLAEMSREVVIKL